MNQIKNGKGLKAEAVVAEEPHGTDAWRHPSHRQIKISRKTVAAFALLEMGISDYTTIAPAVGLSVEEVKRIDMVSDQSVRQLCRVGIPEGEYFRLARIVRCPKCRANIRVAPCVACGVGGHGR